MPSDAAINATANVEAGSTAAATGLAELAMAPHGHSQKPVFTPELCDLCLKVSQSTEDVRQAVFREDARRGTQKKRVETL